MPGTRPVPLFETLQYRRGRVLFVSQSNACRSQMAEAFARALGEDAMLAFSAGICPASEIPAAARMVMDEKAVPLFTDQKPKTLADFDVGGFDVVVGLGAVRFPAGVALQTALVLEPLVPSPIRNDL